MRDVHKEVLIDVIIAADTGAGNINPGARHTNVPPGGRHRSLRAEKENRMVERVAFVNAISEPDGMRRHRCGFECAANIRLMHALVRRRMHRKSRACFDYATDGNPMSRPDTLVGIPVPGVSNPLLLRGVGVAVTLDPFESVDMLWRYVV